MRRATWILIAAVLVINVGAQAYSIPVTDFIRHRSTSVTTDMALRFGYFALMLLTAFVEALLFDELVYRGAWRRRFLGGHAKSDGAAPGQPDLSDGLVDESLSDEAFDAKLEKGGGGWRRLVAENSLPFFLSFFVLLGGNLLLWNVLNGWFDAYYSKTGHLITQLRSSDPAERQKAILGLSYHRGTHIERLLVDRLEKGTDKEKVWAAWALGYRRRIKLPLEGGASLDRGEKLLRELLSRGTDREKQVAAVALARYVVRRAENAGATDVPALERLLRQQQQAGKVPLETVVAMGWIRSKAAIPVLAGLLTSEDHTLATAAAWALGRMQHLSAVKPLLKGLRKAAPQVRCGIVNALGELGHAALVSKPLMDEFLRKNSGFSCDHQAVVLRPDGRGKQIHDKLHLVSGQGRYRLRILRVMNKIGFLDDALPWLKTIAAPGSPYHKLVRQYARSRYQALRRLIEQDRGGR